MTELAEIPSSPKPATVLPEGSDIPLDEAIALNEKIDAGLEAGKELIATYLSTAGHLTRMKESKGYVALGHNSWEAYLASKPQGRVHLSYLLKLGQAGDLSTFLEDGMTPAILMEYVKGIGYPEKLPALIAATKEDVFDLPARTAARRIQEYVTDHPEYKKPRKKREVRPAQPDAAPEVSIPTPAPMVSMTPSTLVVGPTEPVCWELRFQNEYSQLMGTERKRYCQGMKDFLEGLGESA